MASQDQTSRIPRWLSKLLSILMGGLSIALSVLGLGGQRQCRVLCAGWPSWWGLLLGLSLLFAAGAVVVGRLNRFKPAYLLGWAGVGWLLLGGFLLPNFEINRPAGNQASAVGSLRILNTAEITYASTYNIGYSPTLSCLGQAAGNPTAIAAGLIDSVLAGKWNTSEKYGYRFVYSPGPQDGKGQINSYTITASPIQPGVTTGTNSYYTDQTGVIRQNSTGPAGPKDPPLAG